MSATESEPKPDQSSEAEFKPASVWSLAWPNIVSNLCNALVNLSQIKIVAALGTAAIAGVTTSHRFFFLLQAVMMGLSTAATATVARSWGAREQGRAGEYTWNALWLGIGLAAILSIIVFIYPQIFVAPFGLEADAANYSEIIIRWVSLFNVLLAVGIILTAALRAVGDVINPMLYTVVFTVSNIGLAYAFTNGTLGLPSLGIYGLPVGIGLAVCVCNLGLLMLWLRQGFVLRPPATRRIDKDRSRELIRIGMPAAIEQGLVHAGFIIFLAFVAGYGTPPYAAYGIGVSLLTVSIVIGFGFSIAGATLVGQYLGAGEPEKARAAGWRSTVLALVTMSFLAIFIVIWAEPVARFMVDDDEVVRYTVTFIYILAGVHPLIALELSLAGALRGAGDTRFPLVSTVIGLLLGRIGIAWLFVQLGLSVEWVYCSIIGEYLIKAVLITWRFHGGKWMKMQVA